MLNPDAIEEARVGEKEVVGLALGSNVFWNSTLSYAQEVLADNPIAYYRFEETEGPTVVDETSGLVGTVYGANLNVDGRIGSGASFDGVNDSIVTPETTSITGNDPWSLEMWAKVNSGGPSRQGWYWWSGPSSQSANRLISVSCTSNRIEVAHWANDWTSNVSVALGEWQHIVVTYDGANERIYSNGALADSRVTGPLIITSGDWTIAARPGASQSQYLNSVIDEPAIYDYALSPERILAHYQAANTAA